MYVYASVYIGKVSKYITILTWR